MLARQPLDERWLIVHLNELSEEDFALLAHGSAFPHRALSAERPLFFASAFRAGTAARPRLQHLPRHRQLGEQRLAEPFLRNASGARRSTPTFTPREILEMATVNGARALGQADAIGRIAPGSSPI